MDKSIRRPDWESLSPTVRGLGINDVTYEVYSRVDGKRVMCEYYSDWFHIIERVACPKYKQKHPSYNGVDIDPLWIYFYNFILWVDSQPNKNWRDCTPDKDFLSGESKIYSPETVVYIDQALNKFLTDSSRSRGIYMIGVTPYPKNVLKPYRAQCQNPFTGKQKHLGYFSTEYEAHKAWQAYKHYIACSLADQQTDERVATRLREMYAPDKDWTKI